MPTGKPRNPANERFWRDTLTHWQSSGLSVAGYGRRYRVSAASFYAWRRELARRDDATRATATAATFLPVQVLADRTPAIEIVLANDRVVRVPPGFDERTLRRVLALAEDAVRCFDCGKVRQVKLDFADPGKRYTRAFERYGSSGKICNTRGNGNPYEFGFGMLQI